MVAISGTYDVMLVPLLMPISDVLNFLPPAVRDIQPSPLISFTHNEIEALGLDPSTYNAGSNHPVMLELGYQHRTGPGPRLFRPSFDEAKLDILGMRHPSLGDNQPFTAEKGFVFKQMILFSNVVLSTSSSWIAGLRSTLATVTPTNSPSRHKHGQDDDTIDYNVKDYIETTFSKKQNESSDKASDVDNAAVRWAGRPWYGWRVSDSVTQFHFNTKDAEIPPIPYKADVRIHVANFYDPSVADQADQVTPEWFNFDGTNAWRFKANYFSSDSKASQSS